MSQRYSDWKQTTAVFTFGRFNPPHKGHEKLIKKLESYGLPSFVFLSLSHDNKRNPLTATDKVRFVKNMVKPTTTVDTARNVILALDTLAGKYQNLIMVVGDDRVKDFIKAMDAYVKQSGKFKSITVESAGSRSFGNGISATKMREMATNGDFEGFKDNLPQALQNRAKEVFEKTRSGLNA